MYYKNPLTRFILRKNWFRRVRMRLSYYKRKLTKDSFDDLQYILQGTNVTTIFDLGANIGYVTYQFTKRFPQAHIYPFEPNPTVFEQLREAYKNNPLVSTLNVGVGDCETTLLFNVNANTGTSSFLEPTRYHEAHQARKRLTPLATQVVSLDVFAQQKQIDSINILKLDIEGYELNALRGARELLRNQRVDTIYSEVSLVPQYEGQPLFHDITAFLEDLGYHLYNLDSFVGQETPLRQATIGNATYISDKHRSFLEQQFGHENCGW